MTSFAMDDRNFCCCRARGDLEQRQAKQPEYCKKSLRKNMSRTAYSVLLSVLILLQCSTVAYCYTSARLFLHHPTSRYQGFLRSTKPGPKLHRFSDAQKWSMQSTIGSMQTKQEEGLQTFFPAADRIVTVGDVHGDANALHACLKMADLIDDDGNWAGGKTHLAQV
jgi:hypothetical protein